MLDRNNFQKILTVAKYTFKEVARSRILLNSFFIGLGLVIITFVAYSLTYGEPSRIALDFGLGLLSISSVGIAIFIGSGLLKSEIENRTVYMIISRPVFRGSFIIGKLLGLIGIMFINTLILSSIFMLLYFIIGGAFSVLIPWAILFIMFEAILVLLVVSLLSLISSQTISIVITIFVYIVGHAIEAVKSVSMVKLNVTLEKVIEFYQYILPAFHKLNIKDFVLYHDSLPAGYLWSNCAYFICYSLSLIILSSLIFERKNLD